MSISDYETERKGWVLLDANWVVCLVYVMLCYAMLCYAMLCYTMEERDWEMWCVYVYIYIINLRLQFLATDITATATDKTAPLSRYTVTYNILPGKCYQQRRLHVCGLC